jgi:aryl-alcohol dehydrogenase-like predicted oxidoreductase
MRRRRLGENGPEVSAIGLGCMSMTGVYGPGDEDEGVETIHRALDLGIDFLDTADVYGAGKNEELVGRAIRDRREQVFLATKFGIVLDARGRPGGVGGRPERVHECCEASLARLGVDTIDLYYLHRVDRTVPIEETVGAMASLVEQGKVRFLGLSEAGPQNLARAHATHPIAALQSEYSLWTRDHEERVIPACRERGIAFVAFSPLGRGFLSGRVDSAERLPEGDQRRIQPRFQGENFDRNLERVRALEEIASAQGATAAQVAIAWLLARGEDVIPIPGTKRVRRLEENAAAADLELGREEMARLEELFPPGAAAGERYPEAMMKLVDH